MDSLSSAPKIFGSPRRTETLLLLSLLGESYPGELTRLLGASKAAILQILESLELEGLVASRQLGRTRRVELNPRYYAASEFQTLLRKLATASPDLQRVAASRRSRPRRKGKPL